MMLTGAILGVVAAALVLIVEVCPLLSHIVAVLSTGTVVAVLPPRDRPCSLRSRSCHLKKDSGAELHVKNCRAVILGILELPGTRTFSNKLDVKTTKVFHQELGKSEVMQQVLVFWENRGSLILLYWACRSIAATPLFPNIQEKFQACGRRASLHSQQGVELA